MDLAFRPCTAAGFAATLLAAGVLATPTMAGVPVVPGAGVGAVRLASGDIPLDQVLQNALANATDIYDHFAPASFADLQQFAANIPKYLDGTHNLATDLNLALNAAITPFTPAGAEPYIYSSLDATPSNIVVTTALGSLPISLPGKEDLLGILANGLPTPLGNFDILSRLVGAEEAAAIQPYLEFSGSPLSGVLWGSLGTTVGPILQLHDDIAAITSTLGGASPDYAAALGQLLDVPTNLTDAFLNGYGNVSLDTLLADFGIDSPTTDSGLFVNLGGLLSPAGSLINGIGFTDTFGECDLLCASFTVPATAVGPIASLFLQDQAIAEALGWDGVGQPLSHLFGELASLFN